MKTIIEISYKNSIILDFLERDLENFNDFYFFDYKEIDLKRCNYTGVELADVVCFIQETFQNIIIPGLAYDCLKSSIVNVWQSLKEVNTVRGVENEDGYRFDLRLQDGSKKVNFILNQKINDSEIESIVEKAFDFMKSETQADVPSVNVEYSKEEEAWAFI